MVSCGQRAHLALRGEVAADSESAVLSAAPSVHRPDLLSSSWSKVLQIGAPTYPPNSTGSPAVKDASRPTPQGLTAGDPVLQLRGAGAYRGDRA